MDFTRRGFLARAMPAGAGLAITIAALATVVMKGDAQSRDANTKGAAGNHGALARGVYAVLREGLTPEEAQPGGAPHVTLLYDRKYSEADRNEPPRYVALDTSCFVPLVLSGSPETRKDDRALILVEQWPS